MTKHGFFSHPKGLYVLFFTEMWERFSYYGMRVLLVLYMTQYLLFDPEKARSVLGYNTLESILMGVFGQLNVQQLSSHIYGFYTGFVYLTPLLGGYVADKFWGQHRCVYVGGILMAIGHFLMAIESAFLIALLFLILGNGFFKPNISTQVGNLYEEGDPRKDGAFTIFYMGVNLGAFLSPLICGTLGQKIGWHYGFGAAGVGMILGLCVYHFGRGLVPHESVKSHREKQQAQHAPISAEEWKRIGVIGLLCLLNIVFWGIYEQQGNTLQLWAEERTDWNFFNIFTMPSTWFGSINPLFIFILAPLLSMFWLWQEDRKQQPSSTRKMGYGCMLCGLAYVVMIAAAMVMGETGKGSPFWLIGSTLVVTIGELYLSPIGLSFVSKVAPRRMVSRMMGVWYLASFFGNYASGAFGSLYSVMPKTTFFGLLAGAGIFTGLIFLLLNRPITRVVGHKA